MEYVGIIPFMKKSIFVILSVISIIIFLSLSVFLSQLIRHKLFMPAFLELESNSAKRDVIRCVQSIEREIYHLSLLNSDWAVWNDLYDYTEDLNVSFAESNLEMDTLTDIGLNLIFIISENGELLFNKIYDQEIESEIKLPDLLSKLLQSDYPFMELQQSEETTLSGVILTEKGPMLISGHKIFKSDGSGPSTGIIVMGRFFTREIVDNLNLQTQVNFSVTSPDFGDYSLTEIEEMSKGEGYFVIQPSGTVILGYHVISDIFSEPALLVTANIPRAIYQQGERSSYYASRIIMLSFFLLCFAGGLLFIIYRYRRDVQHRRTEALVDERTKELRAISTQLEALSESTTEGVMLLEDGYCIAMNLKAQEMFGHTLDEFKNHATTELVVKEERERIGGMILNQQEGFYETTGLRKDLSTFPLRVHGKSILFENKSIRAVALVDLTEQKQAEAEKQLLEDKLQRSQKMESIGILAGGVAHDLNNILLGVVTYPELLLLSIDEDSTLRKPLESIRDSGKKAAEVVADLLTVARGVALVMTPLNINEIIKSYLKSPECNSLKYIHSNISITTNFLESIPFIIGAEVHINKIIMNLITNSAEAIGNEGGTISVTTSIEVSPGNFLKLQACPHVVVKVSDNGLGINPADIGRIFEPFYSRKVQGRSGTGLGLAVVWNTMQDHNGTVTVASDESGTTFTLYFPVSEVASTISPDKLDINSMKGNNESILIVDDNEQQLEIANKILTTLNYTVFTANSGEDALQFLAEQKVDLAVLDMIMDPGISGYQTYLQAKELNPELKALIASGFSTGEEVEEAKKLGVSVFIRKPYSIFQIGAAIKTALSEE